MTNLNNSYSVSLRVQCLVIGWSLLVFLAAIVIVIATGDVERVHLAGNVHSVTVRGFLPGVLFSFSVIISVYCTCVLLMIYGVHRGQRHLLVPFLIVNFVYVFVTFTFTVWFTLAFVSFTPTWPLYSSSCIVVLVYFGKVVHEHYLQLSRKLTLDGLP